MSIYLGITTECRRGHDLTLPKSTRLHGKKKTKPWGRYSECVKCERIAADRRGDKRNGSKSK